jgi:hypothetical protein
VPLRATGRLPTLVLLLAAGGVAVYAAARAGGALAGLLAAGAAACAVALIARDAPAAEALSAERVLDRVLLALPGLLTVYFAFNAGGFFPGAPALAAIVLLVLLLLRITLADAPFAGFGRLLAVAVGGLSLFAVWTLLSSAWSDLPAQALIEFDRVLVYLLALVLFGSVPRTPARLRWIVRGLALAIVTVSGIALLTRFFPTTFPTTPNLGNQQLSFPLTYSNALGLFAALGGVLSVYLTTSLHEPRAVRVAAAAAVPILATTVYLSDSRGAFGAAALGLIAFAVLGRPRGFLTGLLATAPLTIVAVSNAHHAEILSSPAFATAAGRAEGEDVAVTLLLCAVGAGGLRLLLALSDRHLRRLSLPSELRGPVTAWAWSIAIVALVGVALAAGIPDRVADYGAPETRGRTDNWEVALRGFREEPLRGFGAGTYESWWNRERPESQASYNVTDGHSLYLEVLSELGVVGFVGLTTALVAMLVALAPIRRGRHRPLYGALFAVGVTWAAHAGVDWDWEMPAVTFWLFAVAGAALAAPEQRVPREVPGQGARVAIGAVLLAAAVGPGLVLSSQRPLDRSVDAFYRGDCTRTIDRAADSIEALATRAEAYEAIGWCQARLGNRQLAVRGMEEAVERDPDNWYLRYGLAVTRGAAGLDPLPAARAARRLNPHALLVDELSAELRLDPAAQRRALLRRARNARLSVGR